ncbi:methyltransferase type 12 [Comamonas serinivorans]|uniref:Methyltransferase type 12 n=1 Tax=Comamonas serinivorans TaxID=1082851 RepID=A0A1Y0ESL9_9BURK|nr:class I SAM-dependent methyltransferase [Comamonas serinivorans]ARU06289.1 methyltransferase type 12 [Comamonas serinivorans]
MSTIDSTPLAQAEQLLTLGQQALAGGHAEAANALLRAARDVPATRLRAHNLIEAHGLPEAFGAMMGLNCAISPADDIFHFFAGHPTSINPIRDYLADGWRTLSELMVLLEQVDQPLLRSPSVLEFASGHGRFTRHLVKVLGAERVTVSDVVGDAVSFAQQAFGVQGLASHAVPEDVEWPRSYALVFVLSLFSHLPRSSWTRWLVRLWDAVAPGGLLVFTTHGQEAVQRANVSLDASGFFFAASSESNAIDAQEYGTAFTSEAFVRGEVAAAFGEAVFTHFAPQWFWHHQDAWVLRKPAE